MSWFRHLERSGRCPYGGEGCGGEGRGKGLDVPGWATALLRWCTVSVCHKYVSPDVALPLPLPFPPIAGLSTPSEYVRMTSTAAAQVGECGPRGAVACAAHMHAAAARSPSSPSRPFLPLPANPSSQPFLPRPPSLPSPARSPNLTSQAILPNQTASHPLVWFSFSWYLQPVPPCPRAWQIFNIYPRKGRLAAGSDADVIILDPRVKHRLGVGASHSPRMDTNVYEGKEVQVRSPGEGGRVSGFAFWKGEKLPATRASRTPGTTGVGIPHARAQLKEQGRGRGASFRQPGGQAQHGMRVSRHVGPCALTADRVRLPTHCPHPHTLPTPTPLNPSYPTTPVTPVSPDLV